MQQDPRKPREPDTPAPDDDEEILDEALEESFPASDPPAPVQPPHHKDEGKH